MAPECPLLSALIKTAYYLNSPAQFFTICLEGTAGGQTHDVTSPQTVSLTVTDVNGYQAMQQIKAVEQCAAVYIPNAFTSNGNGI